MRWFNGLEEGSIGSFEELNRAFGARFMTCSMVSKPLDSLLSMVMREGETLKTYSDRYWETFNEVDGDFEDMAIRTLKVGLLMEHDLRKSLTMLRTYFYVIDISFDKTHFICVWVNLSKFKMIITSVKLKT